MERKNQFKVNILNAKRHEIWAYCKTIERAVNLMEIGIHQGIDSGIFQWHDNKWNAFNGKKYKEATKRKFKVGDRVTTKEYGDGEIKKVHPPHIHFPYLVHFDDGSSDLFVEHGLTLIHKQ